MRPRPRSRSSRGKPPATCAQEINLIARYLSADLQASELTDFESHLAVCRDCVSFLKTYKTTIELTRSFLKSQTPANAPAELSWNLRRKRAKRH